ncbi:MAG: hypothetical protein BRD53_06165 [Bacteroidetes bacterium SW_7_64_58]|nr:MAG: hypothetical protein BRD53_06165 [Bacteroidetes bacterium SW_7_64_58]
MRLRLVVWAFVLGGLLAAPAVAQPGGSLSSFSLLRFDASARTAAMGGAYTAAAGGDVNTMFYNPAIPGPATSRTPSVSYLNHLTDINAGTLAYSHTVSGIGTTLSGGLRFVHWGTIQRRNDVGERTGTFSARDVALTVGAARALGPRVRYGANMHLLYAQIDQVQATAAATDLGVLYRVPAYQLTVGASLRHLGVSLDGFGRRDVTLPLDLQLGLSKRLAHLPLRLSLTAYDLTKAGTGIEGGSTTDHVLAHLTFGGEMRLGDNLRLRLGYNHRRSRDLALADQFDLGGLGGGFGLLVGGVAVDYAYNSWSELGGLHQFTVRADLDAL